MANIAGKIGTALTDHGFTHVYTEDNREYWWVVNGSLVKGTYEEILVNYGESGDTEITVLIKEDISAEPGRWSVKASTFNLATEKIAKILKEAKRAEDSLNRLEYFRV